MERKIEEIVSKNYQNPHFNVNGLSSKLNISRVHLNSIMNFGFGCSPQVYIEKIRIEKAQQSLLEGKKIIDVCKDGANINPHYTNACANLLQAKALDEQNEILKHFYNGTYSRR